MADVSTDDPTERLRAAALRLFTEAGYGSTNVDDIASAAGVGVATFYRRWSDKAALANELLSSTMDQMLPLYDGVGGSTAKQRFLALWRRAWDYATAERERFLLLEGHINGAFVSPENLARKQQFGETMAAMLVDLEVRASPEVASAIITGTMVSLLRTEADIDVDEVGERLWSALRST